MWGVKAFEILEQRRYKQINTCCSEREREREREREGVTVE